VHGKAKIAEVRATRINDALDAEKIVLVAGFQGVSAVSHDVTTLGRGGSDTTAVALAAALGAHACEIYTDVEGVFTADPRIVSSARKLAAVTYEEMLELSASGAKVLQLRSVEFARNHDVRLHVRSTFSDAGGTWIVDEEDPVLEKAIISGVAHTDCERLASSNGSRTRTSTSTRSSRSRATRSSSARRSRTARPARSCSADSTSSGRCATTSAR
jgi:aspartate kinase